MKYLSLVGSKQGAIKGPILQAGREDMIQIISFKHQLSHPIDRTTGLPTGPIRHNPLILVKQIDQSSPRLYAALVNNEMLISIKLDFWSNDPAGLEVFQFRISLDNAYIVSINQVNQNSSSSPELMKFGEYEEISFTYEKIEWSWKDGATALTTWNA